MKKKKRKNFRYHLDGRVCGRFSNHELFIVKDINVDGINLVSNFSPIIGSKYTLHFQNKKEFQKISVEIIRSNIIGFNAESKENGLPYGVLFSVAAKMVNLDDAQEKFLTLLCKENLVDVSSLAPADKPVPNSH